MAMPYSAVAAAFRFLRHPSSPRPLSWSGSAARRGTVDTSDLAIPLAQCVL